MNLKDGFKGLAYKQTNLRDYESTQTLGMRFMAEYKLW